MAPKINLFKEQLRHRVDCAWCGKILKRGKEPISHGVCNSCKDKVIEESKNVIKKLKESIHET